MRSLRRVGGRKGGGGPLCRVCDRESPTADVHGTWKDREGDRGGQMGVAAVEKENVTAEGRGRTQRHCDHSRGFARDSWIHWRLIGPHVTCHVTTCLL